MRIGVYVGSWTLTRLGGMGTYLRELLGGVRRLAQSNVEPVLLVDRANRAAARELDAQAPVVLMDRPSWSDVPACDRRGAIAVRKLSYRAPDLAEVRRSQSWSSAADAFLWGLDDAVMHSSIDGLYFTIPPYVKRPRIPFVLTIHDLKHIHRPQDHDARDLARRRRWGRVARVADAVVSSYAHIRRDVISHLHVSSQRASLIPIAVPDDLRIHRPAAAKSHDSRVPPRFGLFPSQFWPHKNHSLVLLALHHLRRDRGMNIPIVCTGQTGGECAAHFERMCDLARQLRVEDLFVTLGHVEPATLRGLYNQAAFVVAPTLHDPGSFPAMEALALGKPLIASNVTSLPELVGDAGILFDPRSVDELVEALARLWTNAALCAELSARGPERVPRRTWCDVARDWIALCEKVVRAENLMAVVR